MKTRPSPAQTSAAFTLVELLTVIAIIAILMGLLFPALNAVKENGRKVQAKNDVTQIVAAVKHYYTEYGKYPRLTEDNKSSSGGEEAKDQYVGDKAAKAESNNNALFDTLRAIDDKGINNEHKNNPRRIVFFEGKAASDPDNPRSGFLEKEKQSQGGGGTQKGCFFDPWGQQYTVIIDTNYDNMLDVGEIYKDFKDDERPRTGVGAFALGKDNKVGEPKKGLEGRYRDGQKVSDDIISWQ